MSKQSRFEEISRKRSLRNTIIILMGIISLVALFFFYGIFLLINFSVFIGKLKGDKNIEPTIIASSYIAPPILDPLEDATNSAKINISGYASPDHTIRLYVNGKYIDETDVSDNKSFIFRNVVLEDGENKIKAKAVISDKESDYSQNIEIVYKNKEPNLEIFSPKDNQSISNGDSQVMVEGKTDPSVRVTINDYWAIIQTNGNFSYLLRLQKGENTIKIAATDDAGNKSEKEIKVKLE